MVQGHNLFVSTLVTSGLLGTCVLILVFLAAVRSTRAFEVPRHQMVCFGYLIAFLVESATEAMWTLNPDAIMYPVVGLVFTVIIVARHDGVRSDETVGSYLSGSSGVLNAKGSRRRAPTNGHADVTIQ